MRFRPKLPGLRRRISSPLRQGRDHCHHRDCQDRSGSLRVHPLRPCLRQQGRHGCDVPAGACRSEEQAPGPLRSPPRAFPRAAHLTLMTGWIDAEKLATIFTAPCLKQTTSMNGSCAAPSSLCNCAATRRPPAGYLQRRCGTSCSPRVTRKDLRATSGVQCW